MNWQDLRQLRAQGLKPSLPVMVTTHPSSLARLLDCEGFAVLVHKPGETFHAELLDDLRVLLFLDTCTQAQGVVKALRSKGSKPAELRSWCQCLHRLESSPVCCKVAQEWQ